MIEENIERLRQRPHSRIWNSIVLFSLISYMIYLLYMSIILPFFLKYVMPIDFAGSVLLYVILLIFMAFIFWFITFYMQFNPRFYGEPTKFALLSKINVEMMIGLLALILVVLFIPAYYISIVLPFKASEDQITARKTLFEIKRQTQL
ncbi:MAG: hypothetical protein ACFFAJ_11665 [Candidatus Hodarchaeota archaeon]